MKRLTSKKQSDTLLKAFNNEELIEKRNLHRIKGGSEASHYKIETDDAHTIGDIGNCDNDTKWARDKPELN